MPLGEELRKARLQKGMTVSQIAALTRMKTMVVEAMERDDFARVAAPVYARGFIKLYAECVGLDPKPLLDEYAARYAAPLARPALSLAGRPPAPSPAPPAPQPAAPEAPASPAGTDRQWSERVRTAYQRVRLRRQTPTRTLSVVAGVVVILVFLASGLSRCIRAPRRDTGLPRGAAREASLLQLDPPPSYFD